MQPKMPRLFLVDAMRVFAIVMMIAFHFCYDLRYFGWTTWDVPEGNGWRHWRYVILSFFIFTMGASMGLATANGRNYKSFYKRLGQIAACAALITIMSLVMFSQSWIYFGILHFMVLGSCVVFLLANMNWKITTLLGLAILAGFFIGWLPRRWPFDYIPTLPSYTEDFVPLFPWLGVACLGLAFSQWLRQSKPVLERLALIRRDDGIGQAINYSGKRSLWIYMIHQPILFAILIGVGWLVK